MSDGDRRDHPRRPAQVSVILEVELHGYDDGDHRFRCDGRTVNVSRGGLLACVDHEIRPGTRCLAHFPSATGQLGRTMIYGVVHRSRDLSGEFEIAVTFDNPLLGLERSLPDPDAAHPDDAHPAGPDPAGPDTG